MLTGGGPRLCFFPKMDDLGLPSPFLDFNGVPILYPNQLKGRSGQLIEPLPDKL